MTQQSNSQWYAIQTEPLKEKMVANLLASKGYEHFLPLWKPQQSSRLQRAIGLALFPGYLFCKLNLAIRQNPVIATAGVLRIVGAGRVPLVVPDCEVEHLRDVIRNVGGWRAEECMYTGEKVRIVAGAFSGVEGILFRQGRHRVAVQVTMLGRGVSIEVEPNHLTLVNKQTDPIGELASRDRVCEFSWA